MGHVRITKAGYLYFDFHYRGIRSKEFTELKNTPENMKIMTDAMQKIDGEILLGTFIYEKYFPGSKQADKFSGKGKVEGEITFGEYTKQWYKNNKIEWKPSVRKDFSSIIEGHLIKRFGDKEISVITKPIIKEFRTDLSELKGKKGKNLSNKRINNILGVMRLIMNEAAEECGFASPFANLKPLSVMKPEIMPMSLTEVFIFLSFVSKLFGPSEFCEADFTGEYSIQKLYQALKDSGLTVNNCSIEDLNSLLRLPHLYEQIVQENPEKVPSKCLICLKETYDKSGKANDLKRLNRSVLEDFFPEQTPKRKSFHEYYVVRFFTGMRTAEIDGLKWKYVDFVNKKIMVRETWQNKQWVGPKTESSVRDIDMSKRVEEALRAQKKITGRKDLVFCNNKGEPFDYNNISKRIWYPTLEKAGLVPRTPYQTRHTCATLWLASGENPEWIAKQLGHSDTQMLFKIYSKFIPNLTRKDGSAFEKFVDEKSAEMGKK